PPLDGGGFERNSHPRYATATGSRSTTRYPDRSSAVSGTWAQIARASSPSYRTPAPSSAIRSIVAARSPSTSFSPATSTRPPYIASPSGECRSSPSRIRCRYPCAGVSSTPARAAATAGAASAAQSSDPYRECAACSPSAVPGTPTAPGPVWNTCCVSPSKSTARASSSTSAEARGTATNASNTTVALPLRTSMNPPPPGPVSMLSVTQDMKAAATQASTAFPPASSTAAPAAAVRGCPAAIAPCIDITNQSSGFPSITIEDSWGRCNDGGSAGAASPQG